MTRWISPVMTSTEVTLLPRYSSWGRETVNSVLHEHLLLAKRNAKYTSKTIQNEIIHIYACKIREQLTKELREKALPFTVIADEVTDPHANQEILSVCLIKVCGPVLASRSAYQGVPCQFIVHGECECQHNIQKDVRISL